MLNSSFWNSLPVNFRNPCLTTNQAVWYLSGEGMSIKHVNFYEIKADSHREFGRIKGELFIDYIQDCVEDLTKTPDWKTKKPLAERLLALVKTQFPVYYEELMGTSESTDLDLVKLWGVCIEDELDSCFTQKCTSLLPGHTGLIGHSEDWDESAQDAIVILQSTINGQILFDLHYIGTLGGNAFSINSSGLLQAINTLPHADWQIGIPKNILCRRIAEIETIRQIQPLFSTLVRSSGYHHLIYDIHERYLSIECSAKCHEFLEIHPPFSHTNHYLGILSLNHNPGDISSYQRYEVAQKGIRSKSDNTQLAQLLSDDSLGESSLRNPRTIAQVIADFKTMEIKIWLRREQELNWVTYPIDFLVCS